MKIFREVKGIPEPEEEGQEKSGVNAVEGVHDEVKPETAGEEKPERTREEEPEKIQEEKPERAQEEESEKAADI